VGVNGERATPTIVSARESNRRLRFRALLRRSSQIAAYRRISARIPDRGRLPRRYKTPARDHVRFALASETGVIAMQKVVGSNPISRFQEKPRSGWAFRCYREHRIMAVTAGLRLSLPVAAQSTYRLAPGRKERHAAHFPPVETED
jgi:hypothetical protein